ncbi:hypothetical protein C8F01DRAFT_1160089 [Mycena amicta]|nr:hypothetical protein C8F01DRAFT_1160089 [Mycena amicta]
MSYSLLNIDGAWLHPAFQTLMQEGNNLPRIPLEQALRFIDDRDSESQIATKVVVHHFKWPRENLADLTTVAEYFSEVYNRVPRAASLRKLLFELLSLVLLDLLCAVHDDATPRFRARHRVRPEGTSETQQVMATHSLFWYEDSSRHVNEIKGAVPQITSNALQAYATPLCVCLAVSSTCPMKSLSARRNVNPLYCMKAWAAMGTEHRRDSSHPFFYVDRLLWRLMTDVALGRKNVEQCLDAFFDDSEVQDLVAVCNGTDLVAVQKPVHMNSRRLAFENDPRPDEPGSYVLDDDPYEITAEEFQAGSTPHTGEPSYGDSSWMNDKRVDGSDGPCRTQMEDIEPNVDEAGTRDKEQAKAQEEARRVEEERAKKLEEEQARQAEEEQAKQTEERAKKDAEEQAKAAAEQVKKDEEEKAKKVAEEQARLAEEEKAKKVAEEQARLAEEEKAKKVAEEQARLAEEEKAKKAAEEQARLAEEQAKKDEEARLLKEEEAEKNRQKKEARKREKEAKTKEEQEQQRKRAARAEPFPDLNFPPMTYNFTPEVTSFAVYDNVLPRSCDPPGEILKRHLAQDEALKNVRVKFSDGFKLKAYTPNEHQRIRGDLGEPYEYEWRPVAPAKGADDERLVLEEIWNVRCVQHIDGVEWPLHMLPSARDEHFKNDGSQSEVFVISYTDWIMKDTDFAGKILQHRSILGYGVPPPHGGKPPFAKAVARIRDLDSIVEFQDGTLNKREENPTQRIRVGRLRDIIPRGDFRDGKPLLNALSNPMGNHAFVHDIPHWSSLCTHAEALARTADTPGLSQVHSPNEELFWAIMGNAGVKSDSHSDSFGLTLVEPFSKRCNKFWALRTRLETLTGNQGNWLSRLMYEGWNRNQSNAHMQGTEFLWLPDDCFLIMRPAIPHYVLTPSDSVMTGMQFLHVQCMDRAVAVEIHTTFAGKISTNVEHSPARWLFVRVFIYQIDHILKNKRNEHVFDLAQSDQLFQFILLMAYCIVAPALEVSAYKDLQKYGRSTCILPIYKERFQEYVHVCRRVGAFEKIYEEDGLLHGHLEDAIIQMACACVRYRDNLDELDPDTDVDMDKAKFTTAALTEQMANTLQTFAHLRDGGAVTDDIRKQECGLKRRFMKEVEDENKKFELFLDWDRSNMPITFRR